MADNTEQPLDNPEPSTQQQISELRGEVHTLSNAMTTFFARFPVDPPHSDHHDPPPHHNPQPPRNPILNLIPNQQPLNSTISLPFLIPAPQPSITLRLINRSPIPSLLPTLLHSRFCTPNIRSSPKFGFLASRLNLAHS
ncbi:hypothetical protein H4Q26_002810 [Puccinia striiformis f. sp. tritici PST-130]|nr:hypothetical protein H4Q26_002810 [Puccinia striiformis f. sp. tritici PST-130]